MMWNRRGLMWRQDQREKRLRESARRPVLPAPCSGQVEQQLGTAFPKEASSQPGAGSSEQRGASRTGQDDLLRTLIYAPDGPDFRAALAAADEHTLNQSLRTLPRYFRRKRAQLKIALAARRQS